MKTEKKVDTFYINVNKQIHFYFTAQACSSRVALGTDFEL